MMATDTRFSGSGSAKPLDASDRRIVSLLQDNARMAVAAIGRKIGLSGPAVAQRIARLEESGTILAYRAVVNPTNVGATVVAFVGIRETRSDVAHLDRLLGEILRYGEPSSTVVLSTPFMRGLSTTARAHT